MTNANTQRKKTSALTECALLVAISLILSFIKFDGLWGQGGSITLCSMVPIVVASYRKGIKWGLLTGFVSGILQLLIGASALKGNSIGVVIVAVLLDYLVAFSLVGLGGMFRGKFKSPRKELLLGSIISVALRFACHFGSGILIWGSYAPDKYANAIPLYSFVYNGSYMIPEIIITAIAVFFLAPVIMKVKNYE